MGKYVEWTYADKKSGLVFIKNETKYLDENFDRFQAPFLPKKYLRDFFALFFLSGAKTKFPLRENLTPEVYWAQVFRNLKGEFVAADDIFTAIKHYLDVKDENEMNIYDKFTVLPKQFAAKELKLFLLLNQLDEIKSTVYSQVRVDHCVDADSFVADFEMGPTLNTVNLDSRDKAFIKANDIAFKTELEKFKAQKKTTLK